MIRCSITSSTAELEVCRPDQDNGKWNSTNRFSHYCNHVIDFCTAGILTNFKYEWKTARTRAESNVDVLKTCIIFHFAIPTRCAIVYSCYWVFWRQQFYIRAKVMLAEGKFKIVPGLAHYPSHLRPMLLAMITCSCSIDAIGTRQS